MQEQKGWWQNKPKTRANYLQANLQAIIWKH